MKHLLKVCMSFLILMGCTSTAWAANDFKLLTSSGVSVYDQAGGATHVDPNIRFEGPSGVDGVVVNFADGWVQGEDTLECQAQHGITCTFDSASGELTLSGQASVDQYQAVLRSVVYKNQSSSPTTSVKKLRFRVGAQMPFLDETEHFYEYVAANKIFWLDARDAAQARNHYGWQGYLVTLTSAEEDAFAGSLANAQRAWMGCSDADVEDDWRWVTGPEGLEEGGQGRLFWRGRGNSGAPIGNFYANWANGEPNNSGGREEYCHYLGGTNMGGDPTPELIGLWNDVPEDTDTINGYVVEYGDMPGDADIILVNHKELHVNTCDDGVKNGDETGVDCGGSICGACPTDEGCNSDADCQSGVCESNICQAPVCDDGVQNGDETDIDCGGTACDACDNGDACLVDGDCESEVCENNICQVPTCNDGVQNGGETGVDCGGPDCAKCDDGDSCQDGSDCSSGVCDGGVCQAPACDDGVQNGDETDVDCGGSSCGACDDGQDCVEDTDCESNVCDGGVCVQPSCVDGVQNGDETDVDCGGSCAACDDGQTCADDSDCVSGICDDDAQTCTPSTCDDGVQNGDETDVDCGGATCQACDDGQICDEDTDCESGSCNHGTCQAPRCDDGMQNGDETDVDCGGPSCGACDDGQTCQEHTDCQSGVCDGGVCQAPSCDDGVQNGDETDVDCGGDACDACEDGQSCQDDTDCESGLCSDDDICVPATCNDGVLNGDETDVDCGGSCSACDDGQVCEEDSDCQSGICDEGICQPAACDDGVQNGDETNVDCGGGTCDACEDGQMCAVDTDCQSGACEDGTCVPQSCTDGVQNGDETDVDCGGSCGPCDEGQMCVEDDDCQSGICADGTCIEFSLDSPQDGSVTNDPRQPISGTATPGTTVTINANGETVEVTADDNGKWSWTPDEDWPEGEVTVEAGADGHSDTTTFTVDTIAPEVAIDDLDDDGVLTGTGEPGAEVEITVNGKPAGTTTIDEDGNFSVDISEELEDGANEIEVTARDEAGNEGRDSATFDWPTGEKLNGYLTGGGGGCNSANPGAPSLPLLIGFGLLVGLSHTRRRRASLRRQG